jgi:hypothetical protein
MFCIQNAHQAQSEEQKQPERSTSIPDVQTFGEKASRERTLSGVRAVILSAAKDLCVRRARPFAVLRVTAILSKRLPDVRLEAQPLIARADAQSAPGLTRSG